MKHGLCHPGLAVYMAEVSRLRCCLAYLKLSGVVPVDDRCDFSFTFHLALAKSASLVTEDDRASVS